MRILRRLRGLLGLALAWGIAWIPVGISIYFIVEGVSDRAIRWIAVPGLAVRLGTVGALCGVAFGVLTAVLERRRTFLGLTVGRMAVWGALGGCAFPIAVLSTTPLTMGMEEAAVFAIFSALGTLTSLGTLALARRAPEITGGGVHGRLATDSE